MANANRRPLNRAVAPGADDLGVAGESLDHRDGQFVGAKDG